MSKNVEKVLDKIWNDEVLMKEFSLLGSVEEMFEFASKIQSDFTKEEFKAVIKNLIENAEESGEVSGGRTEAKNISGANIAQLLPFTNFNNNRTI